MLRVSMEKRFKIGTAFNIILLTFFGFFAVYHIYSFDHKVRENLEEDIKWFINTEKNVRDCLTLRQKTSEIKCLSENLNSPEVTREILKLREESQEFYNRIGVLIGSESNMLAEVSRQTRHLTSPEIASAEFSIRKAELLGNMQKLTNEMLFLRNRSLQMLTTQKDAIAQTSKTYQSRITLVVILTAIIAFVALFFLSHQIKLPTRKIIEIIRKVRDGNYSIPVRSHTGNEVDQIVAGLSSMAENLRIRDQLKLEKIQLEKRRFSSLANFLNVPLMLINDEKKVAFANDELMTLFRLGWDDLYEIDLGHVPLPVELREKIATYLAEKKWVENEPCEIIGENYAFDLHLSLIPVKAADTAIQSVIIILGRIDCRKRAAPTTAKA
ncbi:MAG: hypothetical protein PHD82_12685 [Candidatus Riflebacteria bacterium]|nr:hypothetical protein [Candidatus Riflebacteria bacterium]